MDRLEETLKENVCTEYEWELFFRNINLVIPIILKKAYAKDLRFLVKGGKAVDVYLKEKIGSPDWDLYVDEPDNIKLVKLIKKELEKENRGELIISENFVLTIKSKKIPITRIGIKMECDDMWLIDIGSIKHDDDEDIGIYRANIINGMPYIQINELIIDLRQTLDDRLSTLKEKSKISCLDFTKIIDLRKRNQENIDEIRGELDELIDKMCKTKSSRRIREEINETLETLEEYYEEKKELYSHEYITEFMKCIKENKHLLDKAGKTEKRLKELQRSIKKRYVSRKLSIEYLRILSKYCNQFYSKRKKYIQLIESPDAEYKINCKDLKVRKVVSRKL